MKESTRPVVMLFSDYYLPGYKSGGGMRTIVNMVDRLGQKYDFRIVTRDHDGREDHEPYDDVEIDGWNTIGKARVYYLSKRNIRLTRLRKLIKDVSPDIVYTNSLLSTLAIYVLKIRKLGIRNNPPFVIAPCGELSTGALRLKKSKKKLFFNYARLIHLYQNIIWKASTELEADEVRALDPRGATILIAPDLPARSLYPEFRSDQKPTKSAGNVKLVFVSRFEPKKNMNWVIPLLDEIKGRVFLEIVGPIQDPDYFEETKRLISDLPDNIKVKTVGPVPHEDVCKTISEHHFFICPTLGENFGHVFLESMAAGSPLIISDRTPWTSLSEKGIGWDIELESPGNWKKVLQKCVDMEDEEYKMMSNASRQFVDDWLTGSDLDRETERVLDHAIEAARGNRAAN